MLSLKAFYPSKENGLPVGERKACLEFAGEFG